MVIQLTGFSSSLAGPNWSQDAGSGKPAKGASKPKAAKAPKTKGKRSRMSSEEVTKRILDAIEAAGAVGASQIAISKDAGLNYQTVVKRLKAGLKGVKKTGQGRDARFFLT